MTDYSEEILSKLALVFLVALLAAILLLSQPFLPHSEPTTSAHAESLVFDQFGKLRVNGERSRTIDYSVVEGDTLSSIALHFFGAAHHYPQIAAKNQLPDAGYLQVGQRLTLDIEPKVEPRVIVETVFNATGYSCSQNENTSHFENGVEVCNQTASGVMPSWGTIAVDPKVIPMGTRVEIREFPGTTFIAWDTGGAIVGRKIDIWFPTVSEALAFGVSEVHLTVLN